MEIKKLRTKTKNRKYYLKKTRLDKSIKTQDNQIYLPDVYKKLTLAEFMVYCAIKDCVEIFGLDQIVKNTCISDRSVRSSCKRLEELNLINVEKIGKNKLLTIKR